MDPRVTELHFITPMENVRSVQEHGILSHERAAEVEHQTVAMAQVQERRDRKAVPGGLRLHQYANLYFHARNPMLYKRLDSVAGLCVIRVSTAVLGLPGVVMTTENAASNYTRFLAPAQWAIVPWDDVFARDWTHPDQLVYWRLKSRKCAELLVPHVVEPRFIEGAHVVDQAAAERLGGLGCTLAININPDLFFRL